MAICGLPKVKIHLLDYGRGTIEIDGVSMGAVTEIEVLGGVDRIPKVALRIAASEVEMTAESAAIIARYVEKPVEPVQATRLNPDGPVVSSLVGLIMEAMKHEFPWLTNPPAEIKPVPASEPALGLANVTDVFSRHTLDARGTTGAVGRVSFER